MTQGKEEDIILRVRHGVILSIAMLSNSKKSNSQPYTSWRSIPFEPETKCYVSVASDGYQEPYTIGSLLSGGKDHFFASEDGQCSPYFQVSCHIYETESDAIEQATRRGRGDKSVYILKMDCTADEVSKLAARGQFSKGIIEAVNAKEWYFSSLLKDPAKVKVEIMPNKNFDLSLLQDALSNNMENVIPTEAINNSM